MKHDILADVGQSNSQPFDAVATIRYGSLAIMVGTTCDDQPFETGLNLAPKVVCRLAELDKLAERIP